MKKLLLCVALLLAITPLSLAVQPAAAQEAAITVAFTESQPNTLDPAAATSVDEFQLMRNICEGLTAYDPTTLKPMAGLAESWEISDDSLTYTFKLRQGVTFSDGSAFDANDVKYSLDRLASPSIGTSYVAGLVLANVVGWADARPAVVSVGENTPTPSPVPPAEGLSGVEVVDPATVKITLTKPQSSFLTVLSLPGAVMLAQDSSIGDNGPVCTGPYTVSEFVQQDHLTLKANENYWGGAPEVKQVTIRVIPEASSQVIEFEGGGLDIAVAPEADLPRIRDDATLSPQLHNIPVLSLFNLRINLKDPQLSDVRVRKALAIAIDRQTIVDTVLAGQGQPAYGLYPPGLPTYSQSFNPFPYDPAAAKALLAEAGYPDGIELSVRTGQVETENRVLNALAATVAEAGITLTVNSTEASVYTTDRNSCNMQLGSIGWTMDYPDPENMVVLVSKNGASRTACGYGELEVSQQIADLTAQAAAAPLGPDRDALYAQIQQITIADQVMIIPIYNGVTTRLISSRLGGMPIDNNGTQRYALITLSK
ncbi:MAG: ABC transporter substrate-binding protein [Anaerolineae bacterium]